MKQYLRIISISMVILACTPAQIQQATQAIGGILEEDDKLTTGDVISGLKEALNQGVAKGTRQASAIDGFLKNTEIKIPFPPDVQKVENRLRDFGLGNEVDRFVETLNRGAEEAAKEAAPIFLNAITSMSIEDAWGILKGEKNAATQYLKTNTTNQLIEKFQPVMGRALDKTNATKYYSEIVSRYNKIPLVEKVNPDLNEYATQRAIDGLFVLVEKEEQNIRANPAARATEILKKVFSQQD